MTFSPTVLGSKHLNIYFRFIVLTEITNSSARGKEWILCGSCIINSSHLKLWDLGCSGTKHLLFPLHIPELFCVCSKSYYHLRWKLWWMSNSRCFCVHVKREKWLIRVYVCTSGVFGQTPLTNAWFAGTLTMLWIKAHKPGDYVCVCKRDGSACWNIPPLAGVITIHANPLYRE